MAGANWEGMREFLPESIRNLVTDRALARIAEYAPVLGGHIQGPGGMSGALSAVSGNRAFAQWLASILDRLNDDSLEKFVRNFLVGMVIEGHAARRRATDNGYELPITLVINPTMRCNLRCTGCYAFNFEKNADMPYELVAKVLGEAREMGIRFITLTGGEPLLYPDLFRMFEEFSDLQFMMYTNGTFISPEKARRMAALGNVMPAISVEGYEEETNFRRGKGIYAKVLAAMKNLREAGVMFGFSVTPTRLNSDLIADDKFIDTYMAEGALFGWFFNYIPVGLDPAMDLMATPKQRDALRKITLRWRVEKPLLLGDFWNDGPCVGGCLSASKYAFVNVTGDVQPCTFVHFATHNVKDHTLEEIFRSPLFSRIRDAQPYHPNLLRPCKIIDHPEVLREIVDEVGARETCEGARTVLDDPVLRAFLDDYSEKWGAIADRAWETDYKGGREVEVPFFGRVNLWDIFPYRMNRAQEVAEKKNKSVA
jgi:MoaA/NifB/PqqE/SkfB family radical SAM enzyme